MKEVLTGSTPRFNPGWLLFAAVAASIFLIWILPTFHASSEINRQELKIEKSVGKNDKHASQAAREKAEQAWKKAKEAYEQLASKPNKTKADKAKLDKLKKQVEHWRKKKDWSGENHSQKQKGN